MLTKTETRGSFETLEKLLKDIEGYESHDFKGHFHNYPKWFLPHVVSEVRMSLFSRFLEAYLEEATLNQAVDGFREEDLKKGRIKDASYGMDCPECGRRVRFDLVDGVKLVASGRRCKYPNGHPEIVTHLDVPSGEIVLFNDFRHVYYANDYKVDFNLNTTDGIRQYSEFYAKRGLIIHFVGNTCPRVHQVDEGNIQIGSWWEDDEEKGPGEKLGSICTDLWWYCAADREGFEKKARKTVEQYQKEYHKTGAWPKIIRAKVKPGRYKTVGRYHMLDDGAGGMYSGIKYEEPIKGKCQC